MTFEKANEMAKSDDYIVRLKALDFFDINEEVSLCDECDHSDECEFNTDEIGTAVTRCNFYK